MKILFLAEQLYFPQLYGGVQTSTDELCHALIERGHRVSLLVKLAPGGALGRKGRIVSKINKLLRKVSVARDRGLGYPVWRAWFPLEAVDYVCAREKPDLIVVMTGGKIMPVALRAQRTGIPLLVQLHDIAFEEYGDAFRQMGNIPYVANSAYTARRYNEVYGVTPTIINPFISTAKYLTRHSGDAVLFINPVSQKGVYKVLEMAALCPDIPFLFIEGWSLSDSQREELEAALAARGNVTFLPSQKDMRAVYEKCKILLVPSTYEETFGRVAAEAQANGIPVIASTTGGLPETVGDGGLTIDPQAPAETWVKALRGLWDDPQAYAALSAKARAYSQRPQLDRTYQTDQWEQAFVTAAAKPPNVIPDSGAAA